MTFSRFLTEKGTKLELYKQTLDKEEQFIELSQFLEEHPKVISLQLEAMKLNDRDIENIVNILKNPTINISQLHLNGNDIGPQGALYIAELLKSENKLTTLNVASNPLESLGLAHIAEALAHPNNHITYLNIRSISAMENKCEKTIYSRNGFFELITALTSEHNHVKTLKMGINKLAEYDLDTFFSRLSNQKECKLVSLELTDSYLGIYPYLIPAAKALAEFLTHPNHLSELDISYSGLGNPGFLEIVKTLRNPHNRLKSLRLSNCNIQKEGILALAGAYQSPVDDTIALKPMVELTTLHLSSNEIGEDGAKAIAQIFKEKTNQLRSLKIAACKIGDAGAFAISEAIKDQNISLEMLDLSNNQLTVESVERLSSLFKFVSTLNISNNKLSEEGCKTLMSPLLKPDCILQSLIMYDTGISKDALPIFCSLFVQSHLASISLTGKLPGTWRRFQSESEQQVDLTLPLKWSPDSDIHEQFSPVIRERLAITLALYTIPPKSTNPLIRSLPYELLFNVLGWVAMTDAIFEAYINNDLPTEPADSCLRH